MRTIYLLLLLLLFSVVSNAQKPSEKIGAYYRFAEENDLFRSDELIGGPGYRGNGSFAIGIGYEKKLTGALYFVTGLEYSRSDIQVSPAPNPEIDWYEREADIQLLSIPLYGKLVFLRYFYLQAGPLIDFQLNKSDQSIDDQTGIGAGFGLGASLPVKKLEIIFGPFCKSHTLIPFNREGHQQHLWESGFTFGLNYCF